MFRDRAGQLLDLELGPLEARDALPVQLLAARNSAIASSTATSPRSSRVTISSSSRCSSSNERPRSRPAPPSPRAEPAGSELNLERSPGARSAASRRLRLSARSRTRARASRAGRALGAARPRGRARRGAARGAAGRGARRSPRRSSWGGRARPVSAARGRGADASRRARPGVPVRDDERAGRGRRRCAHVGSEVAERRVLLVPDGRDDRHAGRSDCAHDRLVAERQQVLEAAAAAREHDDVHLGMRRERRERGDDRLAAPLPWTRVSQTTTFVAGKRAPIVATRSPRAAASAPVRIPTARGTRGSGRFRSGANSPSAASRRLSCSSATRCSPMPTRSIVVARNPSSPLSSYSSARPATWTVSPSVSSSSRRSNVRRAIVTLRLAPVPGSFSVRKTFAQASFRRSSVTSPSTQTAGSRPRSARARG